MLIKIIDPTKEEDLQIGEFYQAENERGQLVYFKFNLTDLFKIFCNLNAHCEIIIWSSFSSMLTDNILKHFSRAYGLISHVLTLNDCVRSKDLIIKDFGLLLRSGERQIDRIIAVDSNRMQFEEDIISLMLNNSFDGCKYPDLETAKDYLLAHFRQGPTT